MDNPQLAEARKYIQDALTSLQNFSDPLARPEIQSTESLQKAEQALSMLKPSLSDQEKKDVTKSEQAILKAKQSILTSELSKGKSNS